MIFAVVAWIASVDLVSIVPSPVGNSLFRGSPDDTFIDQIGQQRGRFASIAAPTPGTCYRAGTGPRNSPSTSCQNACHVWRSGSGRLPSAAGLRTPARTG